MGKNSIEATIKEIIDASSTAPAAISFACFTEL